MQTALSIQELGKLYHKLLRDIEGTIVISVINYIHSPKSVSVLNLRWLPLSKLTKRANLVNVAESNVADILMSSIPVSFYEFFIWKFDKIFSLKLESRKSWEISSCKSNTGHNVFPPRSIGCIINSQLITVCYFVTIWNSFILICIFFLFEKHIIFYIAYFAGSNYISPS